MRADAVSDATATRMRPGIATSSKWVLLGTAVTKPLQLATTVTLARMLGPADFGTFGLATATAVTLSSAVGMGLGEAASKLVAEHFRRDRATAAEISSLIVWVVSLLGALGLGSAWLSRAWWAPRLFHGAAGEPLVALCLLLAYGNLLVSLAINLLTGLQQFPRLTRLTVLQASLTCGLAALFGWWLGLYGTLTAAVLSAAGCVAWSLRQLHTIDRTLLSLPRAAAFGNLGKIINFSLPSWLGGFLISPITLFAFSYLAFQPEGRAQLGAFNSANGFKMFVAILPGLVGSVLGPAIIEEAGRRGDRQAYAQLIDNALAALAILTLPATIVLILVSDVVFLLYGAEYKGAYALFMPMAAGIAAAVLCAPMQFAIVAANRTWSLLGISVAKAAVLLALALAWIPGSLAAGLAWASLAAELSFAIMVAEFSAWNGLTSRAASGVLYRYAASVLVVLGAALFVPAAWRWFAALPLAFAVTVVIIRRHPESVAWIAGAVPPPFRGAVRRGLALAAGDGA